MPLFTLAQQSGDTLFIAGDTLANVTVHGFEFNRKSALTTVVKVIALNNADLYNKTSLVHGFNSIAGVRMEERSPGSYRINIRGSSLRSPFGVRNVKVYWNDIPVTDAGGNTYFNQFAFNNFGIIDIYKGPAGSLYGAGTGGLITMQPTWKKGIKAEYITGSYNLQNVFLQADYGSNENQNSISYAHNESDGYRDHTHMRRDNASWSSRIKISGKQQLSANVLFTNLAYETPGALTLAELNKNPKAARPAAGVLPSAEQSKAAIYQTNFLAGITSEYQLSKWWKNSTTLYASYTQLKNPSIRNYEKRSEPNLGGRSFFSWEKTTEKNAFKWVTGVEYQTGFFNTKVAANSNGNAGTLQTDDDISLQTGFVFSQVDIVINQEWFITTGASINSNKAAITRVNVSPVNTQSRRYSNQFAPRISLLKKIKENISLSATISKGYSAPTIGELLPSTSIINTALEAEQGINYEATAKWQPFKKQLLFELTAYHFALKNALVQRRDLSGADYYVNAGGSNQNGMEISASYTRFFQHSAINYIYFTSAYSYSHYRYQNLKKDTADFSGHSLPGVPVNSLSILGNMAFKYGWYINLNAYLASEIFLNDANTQKANGYQLLGSRLGWKKTWKEKWQTNFYIGADNMLNQQYSLGNDLNDPRGRYYNTAPARNFYIGIAMAIQLKSKT